MKILLDECVTKKIKGLLPEHEVSTVTEMNFNGLKDGPLLAAAEKANFDILLTIDKNIDFQQNVGKYAISIVILDVQRSNLKYLEEILPYFKNQLFSFQKRKSYRIEKE